MARSIILPEMKHSAFKKAEDENELSWYVLHESHSITMY